MRLFEKKMKQLLSDLDKKVNNERGEVLKSIQESVDFLNDFIRSNNDAFVVLLSGFRDIYRCNKLNTRNIYFKFDDNLIHVYRHFIGIFLVVILEGHKRCYFKLSLGENGIIKSEFKVLHLKDYYDFDKENNQYEIILDKKLDLSELTLNDLKIIDMDMKNFVDEMKSLMNISIEERIISAIENVYKEIEL